MPKKDPEHIGSILKDLFDNPEWESQLKASQPLLHWQDIVGPRIAGQSQPEALKDGVLIVRVENSAWLHHLSFLKEELRQRLNKELPSLEIKEIRLRQGPLDKIRPTPFPTSSCKTQVSQRGRESPKPLSPDQLELLKAVGDPELRRDLESLLKRQRESSRR